MIYTTVYIHIHIYSTNIIYAMNQVDKMCKACSTDGNYDIWVKKY